jgi:hypothetical protein
MATLLRLYSYLYHLILCLFLLAISSIAVLSHSGTLRLEMLPWKGDELIYWVFLGSLAGLACLVLAITGIFRYLFPFWALLIVVLMVRGFLLGGYTFSGRDEFNWILGLIAGAILAFLASLTLFTSSARRKRA